MSIFAYLLFMPFCFLWLFLIWWLIKPNYFPLNATVKLPKRSIIILQTLVVYLVLLIAFLLVIDNTDSNELAGAASGIEIAAFFFSILLLVLLGVWSTKVAKVRKQMVETVNDQPPKTVESTSRPPPIIENPKLETPVTTLSADTIKSEPLSNNNYDDLIEKFPELNDLEFDDNGNLKTSFEPEPWWNKHSDADFRIGVFTKDADLKLYYCKVDDLYQNKKGDWIVGVIDTKNYTDKTFNIYKIDDLEDKWGTQYLLYEDMILAFADELGIEVDIWGENDELEVEPQKQPVKVEKAPTPKPKTKPRKRVAKEEPSHSMVYVDSKGNLSEREINIRNVEAKDGKLYVKAYCFKRKRLRTFMAKNIISLYDLASKQSFVDEDEVYNELLSWVLENE